METLNVSIVPAGPADLNLSDGVVSKDRPEAEFSVTFLVLMLLSGLTVLTNSLILASFYVERKLRTYTNCFILNMTIADFVVGLFCMPILSMMHLFNGWPFGKVASIFFTGFQNSSLGVSVCGVVVVCIDRYLATFYPIQHYQRRSIRMATVINALTWIASFGVWMMVFSAWDFIKPTNLVMLSSGISRPNYSLTYTASLLVFALRFGFPFLLMTGLYLRIYFRVKNIGSKHLAKYMRKEKGKGKEQAIATSACKSKKTGPFCTRAQDILEWQTSPNEGTVTVSSISLDMMNTSATTNKVGMDKIDTEEIEYSPNMPNGKKNPINDHPKREDLSREDEDVSGNNVVVKKPAKRESRAEGQKAMRTLTFIVLVFFLTWLPTAVSVTMYALAPLALGPDFYRAINKTTYITRWIAFSNSLVNPLAYAMAQPLIRQTIVKILCARRKP